MLISLFNEAGTDFFFHMGVIEDEIDLFPPTMLCRCDQCPILAIRRKFQTIDADFSQMETVYGAGYRWLPV